MINLVVQPTQTAATSFTSQGFFVGDAPGAFVQATFTGTDVVGSFVIQYSLDGVNWTFTTASTTAVTASKSLIMGSTPSPSWVRVSWTYTSGTGNITVLAAIRQVQQY